jgi:DNA polymerase-3 subunit beta
MMGTDMEMWVECSIPVDVEEEGGVTVPARVLSEIVGDLRDPEVGFATVAAEGVGPETSREVGEAKALAVECGKSSYRMNALPLDEFPVSPQTGKATRISVDGAALRELIRTTIVAASQDETRAILTGALLVCDGQKVTVVATDMHRLAVNSLDADGGTADERTGADARQDSPAAAAAGGQRSIVPTRALRELERILSGAALPVELEIGEKFVAFRAGDTRVATRLIEGQFPNYERVIPADVDKKIVVDRGEFLSALRRAAIVARAEANKVVLRTGARAASAETGGAGGLVIEAESSQVGSGHEEIAARVEPEGVEIEIAFNCEYLIDPLTALRDSEVELAVTGPVTPTILRPTGKTNFLYVVMPMQIL